MTPLYHHLLRHIAADGPLRISDYMQTCLLHPDHGYYTTRDPFGVAGDFITAPEISQMFGELVGLSLAQCWLDQGAPAPFTLAEIGPGRGTLMADILRATAKVPNFHTSLHLHLVEASPALRDSQRSTLTHAEITWHDTVATLPDQPLFLIANEFFDALPIRQFLRDGSGWRERRIGAKNDALEFGLTDIAPQPALVHRLNDTETGDMVEICPAAPAIISEIDRRIATHGGAALIIDYGDWNSTRDTFQAVSNHAFCDPLANPGADDLTAHVDFAALVRDITCTHTKMTPQGEFLHLLGIGARTQTLAAKLGGDALVTHMAAYHRLTDADKMGTLFKVIGLHPEGTAPPAGLGK